MGNLNSICMSKLKSQGNCMSTVMAHISELTCRRLVIAYILQFQNTVYLYKSAVSGFLQCMG